MAYTKELSGKTMVVTGATSGIGRAIAKALALRGAHVIGVGRSQTRCTELQRDIQKTDPMARISTVIADLASQCQVRQLAADIRAMVQYAGNGYIDVLVNNAGAVCSWYTATEDGYEMQFAVNHLAQFTLTCELLPLLVQSPSGRIITMSSSSHYGMRMHWDDVMYRKQYSCLMAYQQTKLANVLFATELNHRLGQHTYVRAYAADPGLVNTEIGLKGTSGIENWVWQKRRAGGVSPEKGAQTAIYLASEPALSQPTAVYWKDCRPIPPSAVAQNGAEAARLWALSEQLCGINWDDARQTRLLQ